MDLMKTPAGWAYPDPGPCACGETAAMRGFQLCHCARVEGGSGHPQSRCEAGGETRTLGCVGYIEVSSEYGGRAHGSR